MNPIMQSLMIKALQYGLGQLQDFMSRQDFAEILDLVCNKVEAYFAEGSFQDIVAENITGAVRSYFDVADSNPDN